MAGHVNYYRWSSTEMYERPYSRTVLIAVDPSESSEEAFDWYMRSIHRPMNRVIVVHVPETKNIEVEKGVRLTEKELMEIVEQDNKQVAEIIDKYRKKLESSGANAVYRLVLGKANEAIVEEARKEDANLIVLGTRGMGRIRRTVLGSVSDYVVQHADVPVIVYRS